MASGICWNNSIAIVVTYVWHEVSDIPLLKYSDTYIGKQESEKWVQPFGKCHIVILKKCFWSKYSPYIHVHYYYLYYFICIFFLHFSLTVTMYTTVPLLRIILLLRRIICWVTDQSWPSIPVSSSKIVKTKGYLKLINPKYCPFYVFL